MIRRYVIGNWKMHGTIGHVESFCSEISTYFQTKSASELVAAFCPPFIYLPLAVKLLENNSEFKLGAQDVSSHQPGAFTGQIAASMLKEFKCTYAIVGHSERRQFCNETDEEIAQKFMAARSAGLIPVLCVGETHQERLADKTAEAVVRQLKYLLTHHGAQAFNGAILAYEPIWAIGTGLSATPEEAQKVHGLLRQTIAEYDPGVAKNLAILYGGSVKAETVSGLSGMPDINGVLVGGASLKADEFIRICEAVGKV